MKYNITRDERAAQILNDNGVTVRSLLDRTFDVASQSGAEPYRVNLKKQSCECKDYQHGNVCKHIRAAQKFETRQNATKCEAAAAPKYKTYDALFAALA